MFKHGPGRGAVLRGRVRSRARTSSTGARQPSLRGTTAWCRKHERQLHALKEHQGPREKPLRLPDVKQMFAEMKGIVG